MFEARYLALLDTVLAQPGRNKVFGHVVVEQQGDAFGETAASFPGAYNGDGFVFLMATLVRVGVLCCAVLSRVQQRLGQVKPLDPRRMAQMHARMPAGRVTFPGK